MRKAWMALGFLICIGALFPTHCLAQLMAEKMDPVMLVPTSPVATPVAEPTIKPTHKFFDRQNISLTAMTFSAALADGITTQHALSIHTSKTSVQNGMISITRTTYIERDPLAAPLVNRGWAGQITATALTTGADLAVRNWLHRSGHHRMERVVPFMFAATSAGFAAHNARYW